MTSQAENTAILNCYRLFFKLKGLLAASPGCSLDVLGNAAQIETEFCAALQILEQSVETEWRVQWEPGWSLDDMKIECRKQGFELNDRDAVTVLRQCRELWHDALGENWGTIWGAAQDLDSEGHISLRQIFPTEEA